MIWWFAVYVIGGLCFAQFGVYAMLAETVEYRSPEWHRWAIVLGMGFLWPVLTVVVVFLAALAILLDT